MKNVFLNTNVLDHDDSDPGSHLLWIYSACTYIQCIDVSFRNGRILQSAYKTAVITYLYRDHECQIICMDLQKHGHYLAIVNRLMLNRAGQCQGDDLLHRVIDECSGVSEELTVSSF